MARDTRQSNTTEKDKTMTLSNISVPDIMEVVQRWRREGLKAARSAIVMTDDPESYTAAEPTTANVLKLGKPFGMAAVRRMLQTLFEEYPYTVDIAKEILTPKDENNDTTGTI